MSDFGKTLDILENAHWSAIENLRQLHEKSPIEGLSEAERVRWEALMESARRSKDEEQSGSTLFGYLMGYALGHGGRREIPDPSKVARFLSAGVHPDEPNSSGCSLLELLMEDHPACLSCAKLLLDAGANPDGLGSKDGSKPPPIYFAAQKGLVDFCRLLALAGAEVNWPGAWSPLAEAARNGRSASLQALIDAGADLEVKTPYGTGAARISALWGHVDCLRVLANSGADLSDIERWIEALPNDWEDLDSQQKALVRSGKKACAALIAPLGSKPKLK